MAAYLLKSMQCGLGVIPCQFNNFLSDPSQNLTKLGMWVVPMALSFQVKYYSPMLCGFWFVVNQIQFFQSPLLYSCYLLNTLSVHKTEYTIL